MLWVLGQVAPQAEDLLHNPAFLVLLGVFATAFLSAIIAVTGYLTKRRIDASDKRREEEEKRRQAMYDALLAVQEKQDRQLDALVLADAQRTERERADVVARKSQQDANTSRFEALERSVTELSKELAKEQGALHGVLNAALGRDPDGK